MSEDIELDVARSERVEKVFEITPTDYQAELLDYGQEKPRAQTAPKKGRQVGATLTAAMLGGDHAVFPPVAPTDVLFTAPSQGTANEMFRECKKLFWNSRFSLEELGVIEDNKETWEFSDGTRILSRTLGNVEQSNNSGNRGMSPTCVIVDEADYTRDAVYTDEIEPFFTTHAEYEFHLFSTPANPNGYFHNKVEVQGHRDVESALEGDTFAWYSPHWPTTISPYAQEDFIKKRERELSDEQFAKEFLGEFPKAGGSAISHEVFIKNVNPDRNRNPTHARYLAVDPARKGDDEMVAVDLDETGTCWNIWSFKTMNGPEFVGFLRAVHHEQDFPEPEIGSNSTPGDGYQGILIEENGVGGFGADFAQAGLGGVVQVVTTTNETKQNIYQRLITDLEKGELQLPKHRKLIEQTTSVQKTFTPTGKAKYSHPPGGHDDYPDALAFCNWARHGGGQPMDVTDNNNVPLAW